MFLEEHQAVIVTAKTAKQYKRETKPVGIIVTDSINKCFYVGKAVNVRIFHKALTDDKGSSAYLNLSEKLRAMTERRRKNIAVYTLPMVNRDKAVQYLQNELRYKKIVVKRNARVDKEIGVYAVKCEDSGIVRCVSMETDADKIAVIKRANTAVDVWVKAGNCATSPYAKTLYNRLAEQKYFYQPEKTSVTLLKRLPKGIDHRAPSRKINTQIVNIFPNDVMALLKAEL